MPSCSRSPPHIDTWGVQVEREGRHTWHTIDADAAQRGDIRRDDTEIGEGGRGRGRRPTLRGRAIGHVAGSRVVVIYREGGDEGAKARRVAYGGVALRYSRVRGLLVRFDGYAHGDEQVCRCGAASAWMTGGIIESSLKTCIHY